VDPLDYLVDSGTRHLYIEQDHVRPVLIDDFDATFAFIRLAHHFQVRLLSEYFGNAFAKHSMVIDNDDVDWHAKRLRPQKRVDYSGVSPHGLDQGRSRAAH